MRKAMLAAAGLFALSGAFVGSLFAAVLCPERILETAGLAALLAVLSGMLVTWADTRPVPWCRVCDSWHSGRCR